MQVATLLLEEDEDHSDDLGSEIEDEVEEELSLHSDNIDEEITPAGQLHEYATTPARDLKGSFCTR